MRPITRTRSLPNPNAYALALLHENLDLNLDEERAPKKRGQWADYPGQPIDLEIGTGNGFHFEHLVRQNPERKILGMEIKYKPLIQTMRRAKRSGQKNFQVIRYSADFIEDLFGPEEIDNVYIHFPDPWAYKARQLKNRLLKKDFLLKLYEIQKPGSLVEFKTDHYGYFHFVMQQLRGTNYQLLRYTEDLHQSIWSKQNFLTHFEKLWTSKGIKTNMLLLRKPH
tara:strand:- start:10366 stop:11037 length:672 start_codon:yes stop_codon:yes gene_type:complete